ncbi:hypothetical protein F511_20263 [Dorcoceras hygrometricum]|uniref:Dystroglycan-like n=1 Tax=Dorcoceras hygrometricum TaxID=472368 RepID=A0A2Z7BQU5_9LAMI|nr:hypothetical protein F511_20263 [Dorcoceras hygrometricum]
MSLFDLQDVCIAIGSIATLDLPMVVDLIRIYGLKGPYNTLTTTEWFLQELSVIPRGSWGDVARRFTMIRWAGFLGCPAVLYEDALVDFFENASVRDGVIISTVAGQLVEISEEWFTESFDLPVDGLGDLSAIPKDVIFDARSIVSLSSEPVSLSGGKNQMKIEFRLLCDIMAKDISVKAGSFNAITIEKFSLMTAIVCGVQMNWARILFSTFKKMVTPGTKQAKGFAVQKSLLLENIPNLDLGESSEFPDSKILTDKTVHRFVSLNDKAGAEEATGALKPNAASKKSVLLMLEQQWLKRRGQRRRELPNAASKKRRTADVGAAVAKKKRTTKKRVSLSKVNLDWMAVAHEAVPIQMIEGSTALATDDTADKPAAVDVFPADRPAEETDSIERIDEQLTAEPAVELSRISSDSPADQVDEEVPWFVRSFLHVDRDNERLFEPGSDSENAMDIEDNSQDLPVVRDTCVCTVGEQEVTAFGEQLLGTNDECSEDIKAEEPAEKSADEFFDEDEARSLEDILLSIPVDVPLLSAGMEITKIVMGNDIKIPEVTKRTWFLNSLPKIPADHKGKAILVEKDPIKGNQAQEHYFLINADIDLLVELRARVIDEVAQFFHSFSLKKLETINIEEMYKKEEQVCPGEKQSRPRSSAIDLSVIDLLSDLHLFILEELTKEARAHGLSWKKPCCSRVFEGEIRDRGAVIARSNTSTRSSCWIRTLVKVDGAWIVEPCADRWVKIPRQFLSCGVHRQRQYDDSLPPVNNFFKTLTKRWADICLEVVEFCASKRLLPVGSLQFCRSLSLVEPVFRVAPSQSPVFALRVSQFCSIFVDFSVFSWLPTADITDFLSSIALNRTVFRSAQISQNTVSVAPSVQLFLDQRQSSSTSAASSSSLNFDATDLDALGSLQQIATCPIGMTRRKMIDPRRMIEGPQREGGPDLKRGNNNNSNGKQIPNTQKCGASPGSIHIINITGTHGKGDRPAEPPLCPAWLPEDPANGQHRPKTQKKENKYEVKPHPSQLGGRHSNPVVTTPMIPLDFSGTTHQSASHNVAPNQVINQSVKGSTYNSKHGITHDRRNQLSPASKFTAAGFLELKSAQGETHGTDFSKSFEQQQLHASTPALIQGSKWVKSERAKLGESSATKIVKNRGWKRRESAVESYGEQ